MKTNNFCKISQETENYIWSNKDLFQQNRKKFLDERLYQDHKALRTINDHLYKQQKSRHEKNKKNIQSINQIIQPQQPQNYLNLSKENKQISIISYKSQPIDLTINQNNQQKSVSMKHYQQKDQQKQSNLNENDNKRTRKYLIKPIDNFQQTAKNVQNQYYKVGGFQDMRKDKTLRQINFKDFNENTLRMKKPPCRHKSNTKQKEHFKSLQKISQRISFCQAYIELSERKTNFLAKQIDYLLNKEFLRESKKYHRSKHEKISKSHSQKVIEHTFESLKFTKDIQKFKRQKCNHRSRNQHRNLEHDQSERNSANRFHYRSNDNKSSRMKQLIYYHQDQRNSKQKQKDKSSKKQRQFENMNLSLKQDSLRQNVKSYDDNSSYLLPQENQHQNISKSVAKNVKINHFLPGQQIVPYINSQLAPESYYHSNNLYQENQYKEISQSKKSQKNIYLTRQFEIYTAKNHKKSHLTDYRKINNEMINKSKKSIKVGNLYNGPQDLINQKKSQENTMINRVKSQKKGQILVDSGKSSQTFKQKQYTFLRYQQSNKKDGSLSNYQIIDSNFNSPKNYDKNVSQSDSRQSQLIQEFNQLVVASAQQDTPQKKRIIQQQIYRTSKQLKEFNEKKVKSELKSR